MVALSVDVEDFIVWFNEGLVGSTWKVEGYVKEVYGFLICFDGDFEAIGLKNFTNLNSMNLKTTCLI